MAGSFDQAPRLETDRLILRAHRETDFPDSAAMWADPNVVRYINAAPSTEEDSWARFLRYRGHWALVGYGYWVVEARADARFVGEVGFADYKRDMDPPLGGVPEAGWVLRHAEAGQGFATEAARCLVEWSDRILHAPKTTCIFDPEHAASIAVARKVGYGGDSHAVYRGGPTLVLAREMREAASGSG